MIAHLSDPWRFKNHQDKAFSYFSHVHHTFSRIDFFLLDNKLLQDVTCCTYHPLVISDHAPVSVDINLSLGNYMFRPWRFPSFKLSDDSFTDFMKSQIDLYFELNQTPEIGLSILWEAFKAFIRGQIISHISYTRKLNASKLVS